MTIKQQGGVFGRNPSFNSADVGNVSISGNQVTVSDANGDLDISANGSGVINIGSNFDVADGKTGTIANLPNNSGNTTVATFGDGSTTGNLDVRFDVNSALTGPAYTARFQNTKNVAVRYDRWYSFGETAQFYQNNGKVGSISVTSSATAYNTSSDYRLKENIHPMVGAADRLKQLKPVNFAWKIDGSRVDGFIAHEAAEIVPEAVHGEKDAVDADGQPQYQGIDQSKLVPLLTAALQEALARIDALEAKIGG